MFDKEWFDSLERIILEDNFVKNRLLRTNPSSETLDLLKTRPLKGSLKSEQLADFVECALIRPWPAIELATLAFEEAKIRVSKGGEKKHLSRIKTIFKKQKIVPIPWLMDARETIRNRAAGLFKNGGSRSNYFVLINLRGNYGCYVGQTGTTNLIDFVDNQSARIAQHFAGTRSSKHVKKKGIEPLWSLNVYTLNITAKSEEIERYETVFNLSLKARAIEVYGNINETLVLVE